MSRGQQIASALRLKALARVLLLASSLIVANAQSGEYGSRTALAAANFVQFTSVSDAIQIGGYSDPLLGRTRASPAPY